MSGGDYNIKAPTSHQDYTENFNDTLNNLNEQDGNEQFSSNNKHINLIMLICAIILILILLFYCLVLNHRDNKIHRIANEQNIIRNNPNRLIQSFLINEEINMSLLITSSPSSYNCLCHQDNELQTARLNSDITRRTITSLNNNEVRNQLITPLLSSISADDDLPSYEEAVKYCNLNHY